MKALILIANLIFYTQRKALKPVYSRDGSGILFFLLQGIYDSKVRMGRKNIEDSPRV
ncbi:hypothetical protein [Reichenbachiella sp. MALMAid0571]|uniref:hypothetical protein n=1 Tax=Reichenbachiella sp. MALMAid0571 TaxID=3143939 RepID=UPI0032DFB409